MRKIPTCKVWTRDVFLPRPLRNLRTRKRAYPIIPHRWFFVCGEYNAVLFGNYMSWYILNTNYKCQDCFEDVNKFEGFSNTDVWLSLCLHDNRLYFVQTPKSKYELNFEREINCLRYADFKTQMQNVFKRYGGIKIRNLDNWDYAGMRLCAYTPKLISNFN